MTYDTAFAPVAPDEAARDDFFTPPPTGMWLLALAAFSMVSTLFVDDVLEILACCIVWGCMAIGVGSVARWVGRYAGVFASNVAEGYRDSAARRSQGRR